MDEKYNCEMKKRSNKGFSIMELIIAFTILAIAGTIVFRLVTSSARFFEKSSADVDLQSESQLAANAIKELIIDCQVSTKYYDTDSNPADVYKDVGGTTEFKNALLINNVDVQYLIYPDPADSSRLMYRSRTRAEGSDPDAFDDVRFETVSEELLAEHVNQFKVDTSLYDKTHVILFSFDYELRGRTYAGEYQVYMRNDITIDGTTTYTRGDEESITQVLVTPSVVTITPNTTVPSVIADSQTFTAVVRTVGRMARTVNWRLDPVAPESIPPTTECTIADGVLTYSDIPTVKSFNVVAESTEDGSKAGSAHVNVKKLENLSITAISGIVGTVDGVQSAAMKSKVQFNADVEGWNLTSADKNVKWKLEYRPNYTMGGDYITITEYTPTGYKNTKTDVGQISSTGLLTLGEHAVNNFEFRITATADFPNYGYPTTYEERSTLLRVDNTAFLFEDKMVRDLNLDLTAYFLSGKAVTEGAVGSSVTSIESFVKVTDSTGKRLSVDAAKLRDGILYLNEDAFRYESSAQYKTYFNDQTIIVTFKDQDDVEQQMRLDFPAVRIYKGSPDADYIVVRKGSSIDVAFGYSGLNVTKASQIGIYLNDQKVAGGSGATGSNTYLSAYLVTTSGGKNTLGTPDSYKDTQTVRLAASSTNRKYPIGAIPMEITIDPLYQITGEDPIATTQSHINYDVYVANVEGQPIYIPGPEDPDWPAGTNTSEGAIYPAKPASIAVNLWKSGTKTYMKYSSRKYVYDTQYKYWKLN